MKFSFYHVPAYLIILISAWARFGALSAFGILAAVYLLMPYYAVGTADLGKGRLR